MLLLACSLPALARPDFGPRFVVDTALPLTLGRPGQEISYRFTCENGGILSTASVFCYDADDPFLTRLGLYADDHGRPAGAALRSGEFVPATQAWSTVALDGVKLTQGTVYHLVLESDLLRAGGLGEDLVHGKARHSHVVDNSANTHFAVFATTLPFHGLRPSGEKDAALKTLFYDGKQWFEHVSQPVFILRLGHGSSEGNPYARPLALPIYAGSQQAQVLHFPCEIVPASLQLRLRKIGKPTAGLSFSILENQYEKHHLAEFARGEVDTSSLGKEWSWVSVPLSTSGKPLFTECYYIALSTTAGTPCPDCRGCSDCFELAGMQAPPGVQGAAEASFDSGAHRSRASSSANGSAWDDQFEADANAVVIGGDCTPWKQAEPARPTMGSAASFSNIWQRAQPWGLARNYLEKEDLQAALAEAEQDLLESQQAFGSFQPGTAFRLEDLALLKWRNADLQGAEAGLEKALAIQTLASQDHDRGRLWLRLAQVDEEWGRLQSSLVKVQRALEFLLSRDLGTVIGCGSCQRPTNVLEHKLEARRLGHRVRSHLEGKPVLQPLQENLLDCEKAWPSGSDEVARARVELGLALLDSGKISEAEKLFAAAEKWLKDHASPNDVSQVLWLAAMAQRAIQASEADKAAPMLRRCADILGRSLAADQPGHVRRLLEHAQMLGMAGDKVAAEKEMAQALDLGRKGLGPQHPLVALIEFHRGMLAGQAQPLQRAREIWRSSYGDQHPALFVCDQALARLR